MENEINIEIDETPKTKPFNVYKLKIALNIIFVILGALMVILFIIIYNFIYYYKSKRR